MTTPTARELIEQTKKGYTPHGEFCGFHASVGVEFAARVERVLALHPCPTESGAKYADLCQCGELWPCATVRALDGQKE